MQKPPENKPKQPPLAKGGTLPGIRAPRVPMIEELPEPERSSGSTMPSNEAPPNERRDSLSALDDNDRALLQRVLTTAKTAIDSSKADREAMNARLEEETRARAALEGKMVSRFGDYDEKLKNLSDDVAELKGLSGDIRGLRGDISSLNANVTANLNMDAVRDRKQHELELKVQSIASDEGRDAGKQAGRSRGAIWGALMGTAGPLILAFLIWLVGVFVNALQGKPPPAFPSLAPAAETAKPNPTGQPPH